MNRKAERRTGHRSEPTSASSMASGPRSTLAVGARRQGPFGSGSTFRDRDETGRTLGARLLGLRAGSPPVILGIPRGGLPVAAEVARALDAPLDVLVVRKLGVSWSPELGFEAIGEGGASVTTPTSSASPASVRRTRSA